VTAAGTRALVIAWAGWAAVVLTYYYAYPLRALANREVSLALDKRSAIGALIMIAAATLAYRRADSWPNLCAWIRNHAHSGRTFRGVLLLAAVAIVPWWMLSNTLVVRLTPIGIPHFPYAGEAAARAGAGLIGFALVWLAAMGAGRLLLFGFRWKAASPIEYVVFVSATGLLVVSFSSYLFAVFGFYTPRSVAVLLAAICLTSAAVPISIPMGDPEAPGPPRGRAEAPWLALAATAGAFGFLAALAPEKEYDALWYHLNLPRLWLDAGRPVDQVEEYVSLYPLTWELVLGAGLTLGGAVAAKLLHFLCLPLLGALVWLAATRYVRAAPAAVAVALVVTTPTMLWESGTAYVDLALAFHAAAAAYALARYAELDERPWAVVAALQFGGAAATKHLGVILTLLSLALYVLWMWRHERSVWTAARRALLIGAGAALLPLPWYVRAALASGNPVFPELFSVFGASPPERWDALTEHGLAGFKARFGFGRSLVDLLALPWNVTVHGARFGGSVGPLFLLLVPAACIVRRGRGVLILLAAAVAGYALVWASPLSSYQIRFVMPIVAPAALLAAAGFRATTDAAGHWSAHGGRLIRVLVFALAVLNLPPFTEWHERDRNGWNGFLTHVLRETPIAVVAGRESESSYLRSELPAFAAWQAINTRLPNDVRVLTFVGGDQFYARRPRIPYDSTIARPAVSVGSDRAPAAIDAMRRLGITHLLFDRRELDRLHAETLAIGSPAIQRACVVVYEDRRVWVCELDYRRLRGN
jgi:hypothetical protein